MVFSRVAVRRAHALTCFVAALTSGACSRAAESASMVGASPLEAVGVLTFRVDSSAPRHFALPAGDVLQWDRAPAVFAPGGRPGALFAMSDTPSEVRPILVMIRGSGGLSAGASLVHVGNSDSGFNVITPMSEPASPCLGGEWVSAFFLEGLGPRPTGSASVYIRADDAWFRLRVDPERHVLKAPRLLRLVRAQIEADTSARFPTYTISYAPLAQRSDVMPLILDRTSRGWNAIGGTGDWGRGFTQLRTIDSVTAGDWVSREWHVHALATPPLCRPG